MFLLNINNKIDINSIKVLIDSFVSHKNNSLVFIFNNYYHIMNNTKIDLDKTNIFYKNDLLKYKALKEFTNYNVIEGLNPLHFFNKRFHHEIFIIENFTEKYFIDKYPFTIKIEFNDYNNNCIFSTNLTIDNMDSLFLDKKCVTTIHHTEHRLIPLWIEYHKKIGFEKFIIYDNNFKKDEINDLYKSIEKYADDVFIIDACWDYFLNSYGNNSVGQCIQQNHCIWKYCPKFLLLTDLDEYVNIKNNYKLFDDNKFISSIPNWFFGCNHNIPYNYDNFIQKLTKKTSNTDPKMRRKCLIQSKFVDIFCVHIPILFYKNINYLDYNECYLNHYIIMSNQKRKCNCHENCIIEDDSISKIL